MPKDFPKLPNRNFRQYYSERRQTTDISKITLPTFKTWFLQIYQDLRSFGYLAEAYGQYCVDMEISGSIGDVSHYFTKVLHKPKLAHISDAIDSLSIDDIFDFIEIVYDLVSKPTDATYHSYNECGWHYNTFSKADGQEELKIMLNPLLEKLDNGFVLNSNGEISLLEDKNLNNLFEASLPNTDKKNVEQRVMDAVNNFRSRHSSITDRRDAVKNLADVLEFLRPTLKNILKKEDEKDLFNLANSFGLRHHNQNQKTDYDEAIWLSWIFYYYLATIHASTRLIEKSKLDIKRKG
ncbi:MAG: hypothetical protein AABY53_04100 [Bdellovibrionota bacterium]